MPRPTWFPTIACESLRPIGSSSTYSKRPSTFPALARELEKMAGFRTVLVHGYDDVDLAIVRDIVENHLSDLLRFVECVRDRLP